MAKTAQELYRDALALSEDEREELLRLLILQADHGWPDPEIEQAWNDECEQRDKAIDRGELELIESGEVHRRVREQLQN